MFSLRDYPWSELQSFRANSEETENKKGLKRGASFLSGEVEKKVT